MLTPSCWAAAPCEPWVSECRSGADPREQRAAVAWPCWGPWAVSVLCGVCSGNSAAMRERGRSWGRLVPQRAGATVTSAEGAAVAGLEEMLQGVPSLPA